MDTNLNLLKKFLHGSRRDQEELNARMPGRVPAPAPPDLRKLIRPNDPRPDKSTDELKRELSDFRRMIDAGRKK